MLDVSVRADVAKGRTPEYLVPGGPRLELRSRSIGSYAHVINRFQAFDPSGIDCTDKVFAKRYTPQIEHGFPNFTIRNCEACHLTSGSDHARIRRAKKGPGKMPGLSNRCETAAGPAIRTGSLTYAWRLRS